MKCLANPQSDIGALFGVALQIPARHIACAGKQRVDAGLNLRRIEDKFCLAVLLRHRVVTVDSDLSEGLVIGGETVAEDGVVHGVGEQGQAQHGGEPDCDHSLEEVFDTGSEGGAHGERLYGRVNLIRRAAVEPICRGSGRFRWMFEFLYDLRGDLRGVALRSTVKSS